MRFIKFECTYLPLSPASASISSKKIIAGAADFAFRKTSLTAFSDSPTHLLNSSGPFPSEMQKILYFGRQHRKEKLKTLESLDSDLDF